MLKSIFHRTSVRKYLPNAVEQDKIELILKAAMAAPSAGNQQPWSFYVVKNQDVIKKLSGTSTHAKCLADAPLAFVVCYSKEGVYPEYNQIDTSLATQNLLLAIDELDLGAVWLGIAPIEERMATVEKLLDIPDGIRAFAIVACGYPVKVNPQQDRYNKDKIKYID